MRPELDRSTRVVRRTMLLMVGLLAVYVAGRAIYLEGWKSRLYAAGQAAAMSGQWPEAFVQFHALVRLDPGYRDARNQLEQVIQKAVRVIPGGNDVDAEVKLLRWLAAAGVETTLAEALDRSVVSIPAGEFLMGSDTGRDDERPPRLVYVDAFELDRYEVTNAQYRRFLQVTRREPPPYWSGERVPAWARRLSCGRSELAGRRGLLRVGRPASADGGRMGESLSGHGWPPLSLGQ